MESKSPWQIYKDSLILKNDNGVDDVADPELAKARFDICKECPLFLADLGACSECGCIMENKTKLKSADCPIHKW